MQLDKIKNLLEESNKLMIYTMAMQCATRYSGEEKFDSANFSRLIQAARKQLEEVTSQNLQD